LITRRYLADIPPRLKFRTGSQAFWLPVGAA
jgi:hypothetical protein